MARRSPQKSAIPSSAQREAIAGAPNGYLLKWSFRLFDDSEVTAMYNDATLIAVPTGGNWQGSCMLISPYQEVKPRQGIDRIVFSEFGTRRIDIVGHELKGRVVCEADCRDPGPERLALCPRGCETVSLDGLDGRALHGWTAEVLRGALGKLSEDPGDWEHLLDLPRSWLSVNPRTRGDGKVRRGHTSNSVPPDEDFVAMGGRLYLDYAVWHGRGVVALAHASAPHWYFCPCEGRRLSLSGENGGMLVEIGGGE